MPDLGESIRSAMLNGYRERGSSRIVEQVHDNGDCYALLANLHAMCNFEDWFDQIGVDAFDVTNEQRENAADQLRKRVERFY